MEVIERCRLLRVDGVGDDVRLRTRAHVVVAGGAAEERQGRAPVAFAAERPVDVVLQPVAVAAILEVVREPVDFAVPFEEALLNARRGHVPARLGVVEQRRVTAPAERVGVLDGAALKHQAALFEVANDVFVRQLHELARAGETICHQTAEVDWLREKESEDLAQGEVLGTECRSDVDDPGAVLHRDEVGGDDPASAFGLACLGHGGQTSLAVETPHLLAERLRAIERFVGQPYHLFAIERGDGLDAFAQDLFGERLGDHEVVVAVAVEAVDRVRLDGEGRVSGQRPGRRGPGHKRDHAGIIEYGTALHEGVGEGHRVHAELHEYTWVRGVVLVALGDFVVAQGRATARAVRRHAVILVDEAVLPELLEDPPAGLDVVVMVSHVGVVEVRPKADALAQARPFFHIAANTFLAFRVERGDAVGLDV